MSWMTFSARSSAASSTAPGPPIVTFEFNVRLGRMIRAPESSLMPQFLLPFNRSLEQDDGRATYGNYEQMFLLTGARSAPRHGALRPFPAAGAPHRSHLPGDRPEHPRSV